MYYSTGPAPGATACGVYAASMQKKRKKDAVSGKGVNRCDPGDINIRDLAAIVLYALGIEMPAVDETGWTSQIPAGMFRDPAIPDCRDLSHQTGAAPRISKVPHTSEPI